MFLVWIGTYKSPVVVAVVSSTFDNREVTAGTFFKVLFETALGFAYNRTKNALVVEFKTEGSACKVKACVFDYVKKMTAFEPCYGTL